MDKTLIPAVVSILLAIIGVAVIAVILSNNSNTSTVLSASGTDFASSLTCALSPILGGGCGNSNSLLPIGTSTSTISYAGL